MEEHSYVSRCALATRNSPKQPMADAPSFHGSHPGKKRGDARQRHDTAMQNLRKTPRSAKRCGSPQGYFAAAAAVLLASARRSVFLRRTARFFTLSLPLQCPIGRATHTFRARLPSCFAAARRKISRHKCGGSENPGGWNGQPARNFRRPAGNILAQRATDRTGTRKLRLRCAQGIRRAAGCDGWAARSTHKKARTAADFPKTARVLSQSPTLKKSMPRRAGRDRVAVERGEKRA